MWFLLALAAHGLWAAAVAVAGARGPRLGRGALWVLAPAVLAIPLLVPLGHPGSGLMRLLLAIQSVVSLLKACELEVGRGRDGYPAGLKAWWWLLYLRPWNHVYARRGVGTPTPLRASLLRVALGCVLLAVGVPLLVASFDADLGRYGFWVDHVAKFAAFYVVLMGVDRVVISSANAVGIPAQPLLRDPAFAYSPADFWQRWNQPINRLFWALVFRRWGRRSAVGALLATFLLSGVMHEYNTAIASLHLRGYQVAFFLLQGVAAALTWRWRPRGAARWGGWALTFVFELGMSVVFFASAVPVFADLVTFYPHGELLPP